MARPRLVRVPCPACGHEGAKEHPERHYLICQECWHRWYENVPEAAVVS